MIKEARICNGEKTISSIVLGKLESHTPKNQTGSLSYAAHKNKLKID